MQEQLTLLNADSTQKRLENLRTLLKGETAAPAVRPQFANNHIHTTYSFSPYSPTAAVWAARAAGLPTAGIMDHDSIAGAAEFRAAAKLAGIGATCGAELRISLKNTPFADKRINNPDQTGVAYMAFHSIRSRYFAAAEAQLAPLREKRNARNRAMLDNIRRVAGFELDFDRDVLPLSQYANGGSVTERHLLFALAGKMQPDCTSAERYRLLGRLKAELVKDIYIPADEELMTLEEAVAFARSVDAIPCYAYLGDVTNSPTGDKKAAKFEDDYLEELLTYLKQHGIHTVTFMPSRNTDVQIDRLMKLCDALDLGQISGEDINSPSQSFICKQLEDPRFTHLVDAAWALVRREADDEIEGK